MKTKTINVKSWSANESQNIALLSDLNLSSYTTAYQEEKLLENLEKLQPNQIVVAGGLYDGTDEELFTDEKLYKSFLRYLKEITEIAPIYFTLSGIEIASSNNENKYKNNVCSFEAYLRLKKFLSDLKENELNCYLLGQHGDLSIRKEGNVSFSGLNVDNSFFTLKSDDARNVLNLYEKYLELVVKKLNNNLYNILVLHDPLIFKHVRNLGLLTKFDLVLGGTSRYSQATKFQNIRLYPDSVFKKYTIGYTDVVTTSEDKISFVRVRKR